MDQKWRPIEDFVGYSISDHGLVRNDETDRLVARRVNNRGIAYVGITRNYQQTTVSVARLVANAFLESHPNEAFDTPINLDGDRINNRVWNLMWRPRWFAVKYHRQFFRGWDKEKGEIEEVQTLEIFEKPLLAAIEYGLLALDISINAWNRTHHGDEHSRVWPTGQRFRSLI